MLVEPCHGFVARCVEDDAAAVEEQDPVGVAERRGRALLRDDDGGAAPERVVEERLRPVGIELRRRLVEEQQLRPEGESGREADALKLAAGELRDAAAGEMRRADGRERGVRPREDLVRPGADVLEPERDLRLDLPEDDLILRILEDRRDGARERRRMRAARVAAGDLDAAAEGAAVEPRHEPAERAHERRLAGARRAEHEDDLAGVDPQRDVVERRRRSRIGEGQPLDGR